MSITHLKSLPEEERVKYACDLINNNTLRTNFLLSKEFFQLFPSEESLRCIKETIFLRKNRRDVLGLFLDLISFEEIAELAKKLRIHWTIRGYEVNGVPHDQYFEPLYVGRSQRLAYLRDLVDAHAQSVRPLFTPNEIQALKQVSYTPLQILKKYYREGRLVLEGGLINRMTREQFVNEYGGNEKDQLKAALDQFLAQPDAAIPLPITPQEFHSRLRNTTVPQLLAELEKSGQLIIRLKNREHTLNGLSQEDFLKFFSSKEVLKFNENLGAYLYRPFTNERCLELRQHHTDLQICAFLSRNPKNYNEESLSQIGFGHAIKDLAKMPTPADFREHAKVKGIAYKVFKEYVETGKLVVEWSGDTFTVSGFTARALAIYYGGLPGSFNEYVGSTPRMLEGIGGLGYFEEYEGHLNTIAKDLKPEHEVKRATEAKVEAASAGPGPVRTKLQRHEGNDLRTYLLSIHNDKFAYIQDCLKQNLLQVKPEANSFSINGMEQSQFFTLFPDCAVKDQIRREIFELYFNQTIGETVPPQQFQKFFTDFRSVEARCLFIECLARKNLLTFEWGEISYDVNGMAVEEVLSQFKTHATRIAEIFNKIKGDNRCIDITSRTDDQCREEIAKLANEADVTVQQPILRTETMFKLLKGKNQLQRHLLLMQWLKYGRVSVKSDGNNFVFNDCLSQEDFTVLFGDISSTPLLLAEWNRVVEKYRNQPLPGLVFTPKVFKECLRSGLNDDVKKEYITRLNEKKALITTVPSDNERFTVQEIDNKELSELVGNRSVMSLLEQIAYRNHIRTLLGKSVGELLGFGFEYFRENIEKMIKEGQIKVCSTGKGTVINGFDSFRMYEGLGHQYDYDHEGVCTLFEQFEAIKRTNKVYPEIGPAEMRKLLHGQSDAKKMAMFATWMANSQLRLNYKNGQLQSVNGISSEEFYKIFPVDSMKTYGLEDIRTQLEIVPKHPIKMFEIFFKNYFKADSNVTQTIYWLIDRDIEFSWADPSIPTMNRIPCELVYNCFNPILSERSQFFQKSTQMASPLQANQIQGTLRQKLEIIRHAIESGLIPVRWVDNKNDFEICGVKFQEFERSFFENTPYQTFLQFINERGEDFEVAKELFSYIEKSYPYYHTAQELNQLIPNVLPHIRGVYITYLINYGYINIVWKEDSCTIGGISLPEFQTLFLKIDDYDLKPEWESLLKLIHDRKTKSNEMHVRKILQLFSIDFRTKYMRDAHPEMFDRV